MFFRKEIVGIQGTDRGISQEKEETALIEEGLEALFRALLFRLVLNAGLLRVGAIGLFPRGATFVGRRHDTYRNYEKEYLPKLREGFELEPELNYEVL